ncbi:hypothetical protein J2782_000226 [Brucella pseudogrignonensis]|uniref:Uncharacterized protein n=1 Tax=Brucella pseudogrignonensis TaxID=419475 RepID=A0ABU1M473_9HYPH|nr:hypothetical protein [Brucella pseudogrignonensis]
MDQLPFTVPPVNSGTKLMLTIVAQTVGTATQKVNAHESQTKTDLQQMRLQTSITTKLAHKFW